jgi:hypothetical protein
MHCVVCNKMLQSNHFSFYFQILSLKFIVIPAATCSVSPSKYMMLRPNLRLASNNIIFTNTFYNNIYAVYLLCGTNIEPIQFFTQN